MANLPQDGNFDDIPDEIEGVPILKIGFKQAIGDDSPEHVAAYRHGKIYLNAKSDHWLNPITKMAEVAGFLSSSDPNHPIYHELGHALHERRNKALFIFARRIKIDAEIAVQVSAYACENGQEFVAEVYAGIQTGHVYTNEVMTHYRHLGGG